jgi:hypothetical protein
MISICQRLAAHEFAIMNKKGSNKMRILSLLILASWSICLAASAEPPHDSTMKHDMPYTHAGLSGSLGHGLGQILTIEGTVLAPESPGPKEDDGKIRLSIDKVEGQMLDKPVILKLDFFAFSQPPEPKAGARVKYIGYETGSFVGIPGEAFKHIPRVASQNYHFALSFQVCKQVP